MGELAGELRLPTLEERLDPRTTALLLVDVQNDFCHPEGFRATCGVPGYSSVDLAQRMREPLWRLLEAARASDALRVFIRGIYDPVYVSLPFAEKLQENGAYGRICLSGTWGADFWEPFVPQPGRREVEVIKHRYSAFHDTDLVAILRANEIRTTVVSGVVTSGCVDSTARDALFHDFFVVVPEDATGDYTEEKHRAHLEKLGRGFGRVLPAERIVDVWESVTTVQRR